MKSNIVFVVAVILISNLQAQLLDSLNLDSIEICSDNLDRRERLGFEIPIEDTSLYELSCYRSIVGKKGDMFCTIKDYSGKLKARGLSGFPSKSKFGVSCQKPYFKRTSYSLGKHGRWEFYDSSGNIFKTAVFERGKELPESIISNDEGALPYWQINSKAIECLSLKEYGYYITKNLIRPSDDTMTFLLLDSLLSYEKEDRQFFYQVFTSMVSKSDGALSEVMGVYALQYIRAFPIEFLTKYDDISTNQEKLVELNTIAQYIQYELGMSGSFYESLNELEKVLVSNSNQTNTQVIQTFLSLIRKDDDLFIK